MPSVSRKSIPIVFLVLLLWLSVIGINDHSRIYAQEFTDCNRQTFSLVDCFGSASQGEETNNHEDSNRGNIEEQIPSVIPFP
ncbi:MAG: hypothetical protein WBX01_05955 [Nitrososphaeraceae archaeon]